MTGQVVLDGQGPCGWQSPALPWTPGRCPRGMVCAGLTGVRNEEADSARRATTPGFRMDHPIGDAGRSSRQGERERNRPAHRQPAPRPAPATRHHRQRRNAQGRPRPGAGQGDPRGPKTTLSGGSASGGRATVRQDAAGGDGPGGPDVRPDSPARRNQRRWSGAVEKLGDKLNVVGNRAKADLLRFKELRRIRGPCDRCLARLSEPGSTGAGPASMTPTPLAATTESGRVRYGGRGRARRCSRRGSHSCRGHRRGTSSESTKTPVEQVRSVDAAPTEVPPDRLRPTGRHRNSHRRVR